MHHRLVTATILASCACSHQSIPEAGPPDLGLDAAATYARFLAEQPRSFKMRHQVESRFGARAEVLEGMLILERPDRFWVRAATPLGGTLFDVRVEPGAPMAVQINIPQIGDPNAPKYLARDIQRIYLSGCPEGAAARGRGPVRVRCSVDLPAVEPGDADTALEIELTGGAALRRKCFFRGDEPTACIEYRDYAEVDGVWLAHRIELSHATLPYGLTIALLQADLHIDAAALFEKAVR